jgi:catechol 2,3-dioxygenase-like lactoylglutathione lyase family enzyme
LKRTYRTVVVAALLLQVAAPVRAQLAPPNDAGVAMGHLHYFVRDLEANQRFWESLGGTSSAFGTSVVVTLPGVLVFLTEGEPTGGTEGSILNHMAFRVRSLDQVADAGFTFDVSDRFTGVTNVFSPEGERIELFDDTATNLTFTLADGGTDPVAARHNAPLGGPVASHHLHLYLTEDAVAAAQAWYAETFGGLPGTRWRYDAVDLPGINFNFSYNPDAGGAPTRGRMLDHIGFEVDDLAGFCARLEATGVRFDTPYTVHSSGIGYAFLTDPWGVTIELTEGLRGL